MDFNRFLYRGPSMVGRLTWTVQVYDDRSENPLPLYNRLLALDWESLAVPDRDLLAAHFGFDRTKDQADQVNIGPPGSPPVFTWTTNQAGRDDRIAIKFRQHFVYLTDEEIEGFSTATADGPQSYESVGINDYIETQEGESISTHEMMKRHTGREQVLILGNVDSVLAQPPIDFKLADKWSQEDSDLIAHFGSVLKQISASPWIDSPCSLTQQDGCITDRKLPGLGELRGVAMLFRQLVENRKIDAVFVRSAALIMRAFKGSPKAVWIQHEVASFNRVLTDDLSFGPFKSPGFQVSGAELLEAFGYGYKLFHAKSQKGAETKLKQLLDDLGREHFIYHLNHTYQQLMHHASQVYHAALPEIRLWRQGNLIPAPKIVSLEDLIGS